MIEVKALAKHGYVHRSLPKKCHFANIRLYFFYTHLNFFFMQFNHWVMQLSSILSTEEFVNKYKGNHTFTGGKVVGYRNFFTMTWTSFMVEDSCYFINGVLHLRAEITIRNRMDIQYKIFSCIGSSEFPVPLFLMSLTLVMILLWYISANCTKGLEWIAQIWQF